jgi:hypothetical protein
MQQLTFDDAPLARRSDPVTSHLAAAQAGELQAAHQREILAALKLGPAGKSEIAARSKLDGHAVARRLPELQRKGLASPTGRTVPSTSGREEREWQLA